MDGKLLERMGCTGEFLERATDLVRKAKVATKPGSGRELGELSTALTPICALFASEELNSGEVTLDMAHKASCLRKKDFNRALQILRAALDYEQSTKATTTYATLLEQYVPNALARKQLETFCQQAEAQLKELGSKMNFKARDNICILVYWVCAAARVKELPESGHYAQSHNVSAKKIAQDCSLYSRKLPSLRKQISQEVQISTPARTPSPTKRPVPGSSTATPRRSARQPQRELLTKESVKKQAASPAVNSATTPLPTASHAAEDDDEEDDTAASFPETPTKRRRLESTPSQPSAKRLFPSNGVASSSRLTLDTTPSPPQTPRKGKAVPARSSPLKRSMVPEPEKFEMTDTRRVAEEEVEDSEDDHDEPQSRLFRRFRPVYLEQKVWARKDSRVRRSVKVGEKRKLEFFKEHGDPFAGITVQ